MGPTSQPRGSTDGLREPTSRLRDPTSRLRALADAYLMPALTTLMVGGLALFVAYPLGRVFVKSLEGEAGLTTDHYAQFFSLTYYLVSLRNSLLLATVTMATSVAVGFVVAYTVTRGPRWLRMPLRLTSLLPLIAPSYILGVALIVLGGRQGLFNQLLGTDIRIFGWPGVILGQALTHFPLCYLMIENVLTSLDPNLEDSASDLGAGSLTVLWTLTLPLAAPGLLKAALMTFALSIADFATPTILGGGLPFLAQDALLLVIGAEYNLQMASVLSVFLVVPSLIVFLVHHYALAGRSYTTVTGRGGRAEARPLGLALGGPFVGLSLLVVAGVLVPMAVVVLGAFTRLVGINNAPTLEHFGNFRGTQSLMFSLRMAAVAAVVVAVVGVLLAYVLARRRFPGRGAVEFVALLGFAIPGTVLGIGYVLAFNEAPLKLTGTFWILVACCAFHYLAVAVEAGLGKLAQIDPSLEEASADLGAGFLTTFGRVVLPLMGTAFVAGLAYAFMNSMLTLSAVVFLVSPGKETASSVIFHFARMGELGLASAVSLLLIGVVLACLAAVWVVARRTGLLVLRAGA
jgi:iron(III) transport system permease protein